MKIFIWLGLILFCGAVAIHSAPISAETNKESVEKEVAAESTETQETGCKFKDKVIAFFKDKFQLSGKGQASVEVTNDCGDTVVSAEFKEHWESEDGKTQIEASAHVDGKFTGGTLSKDPTYGASLSIQHDW